MTIATFYPNAHPESTSCDGRVDDGFAIPVSWAELIAAPGKYSNTGANWIYPAMAGAGVIIGTWRCLYRGIFLFDTSSLAGKVVIGATLSIYGLSKWDDLGVAPDINVYSSNPASNIELAAGDFDTLGIVPYSTAITYANFDTTGYNNFILNAAGIAAINVNGISKFGIRNANYDVAGLAPAWTASKDFGFSCHSADKGGGYRPKLVVVCAAIPIVCTNPATNITVASAILNGTLDNDGGEACDCGFEWGETIPYGNTTPTESKTSGQSFSWPISDLRPNTTYHFRAFATNQAGTSYGNDRTFTTNSVIEVETLPATNITENSAKIWGRVRKVPVTAMARFDWGGNIEYGAQTPWAPGLVSDDMFYHDLRNLAEGRAYHFRAVAMGSALVYGNDMTFTTRSPVGPVVLIQEELAHLMEVS